MARHQAARTLDPEVVSRMSTLLVDALSEPAFYGPDVDHVDVIETHISWVFLAGDRAYKLKKPIKLPFLDYRTRERRRRFCFEEVRLNRRLAPTIYLGVRSIALDGGVLRLAEPSSPHALDWVVEMRRIAPGATLAEQLVASAPDIESVGAIVANFHSSARHVASPAPFESQLRACVDQLTIATSDPIAQRLRGAVLRLHEVCAAELAGRQKAGHVRDCHGDLRAEHVVMGERIEIFDCIEFDPQLRKIDVGADLAFLVMDLERLGARGAAERLIRSYRAGGGDPGSPRLLALFCAYRVCVRALVASIRGQREEAHRLIRLAWRFVWRTHLPMVLVVCGPAAVGKTTVAAEIADLAGIPHLNSDITRKTLAHVPLEVRGDASLYSDRMTRAVYRRLGKDASGAAAGAVVDATFRRAGDRAAFLGALAPVVPIFVECRAPANVIVERARSRTLSPRRISDADASRALEQRREFEPLTEIPLDQRMRVSTDRRIDLVAADVEARLAGHGSVRSTDRSELRKSA